MKKISRILAVLGAGLMTASIAHGDTSSPTAPSNPGLYLTSVARAGSHILAVGERGSAVLSEDDGKTWQVYPTGVSETLTAVTFLSESIGIAIGHGGNIVQTLDGGKTWSSVLRGDQLIKLTHEAVGDMSGSVASADDRSRFAAYAKRLEESGSSEPLLSIRFISAKEGYAVGAYGMVLRTEDAGRSWKVWMTHVENPQELHLYSIVEDKGAMLIVGEQGYVSRSTDGGLTFKKLDTGLSGSFFTAISDGNGTVYLAGLQGQLVSTNNLGESWINHPGAGNVSWISSRVDDNGNIILGNLAGGLFRVSGDRLDPIAVEGQPPLSDFVVGETGNLILVGALGNKVLPRNTKTNNGTEP